MMKINKHIEIIRSSNKQLSAMSSVSCRAIVTVLEKHYTSVGVTIVNTVADLEALVASKPDLAFLGMKFVPEDRPGHLNDTAVVWVSQYLDAHGITYTGSEKYAHELELDKTLAKQCVLKAGLKTSQFYVARQDQLDAYNGMQIKFPVFVKPTNRGGGFGIDSASVAHNFQEMKSKIQSIAAIQHSDSLIEEYLPGREFSVAILKDEYSSEYFVMPIELIAEPDEQGIRLLSGQVKSADRELTIPVTDQPLKSQISSLAMNVFKALGARDYGRIDIRLSKTGVPHFLEANLIPGLISDYGYFPRACVLNLHIDYEPMILRIVRLALLRDHTEDQAPTGYPPKPESFHHVLQSLSV